MSDQTNAASVWRNPFGSVGSLVTSLWGSEVAGRPFDDAPVDDELVSFK